jgi:hypothetical protein
MQIRIRSKQDFFAGLMFVFFGAVAVIVARNYPMGSAIRMGPGYFPTYLGAILIILGIIIAGRALVAHGEGVEGWAWRPLLMLATAFVAFGALMEELKAGFVVALACVILLASLAGREWKAVEVILLMVGLVGGAVALFIYGLELPYPLFWWS